MRAGRHLPVGARAGAGPFSQGCPCRSPQEVAAERLRFWMVHGGLEWPLPKGLHPQLPLEPTPWGKGLSLRP
ncbi:hypothetical protein [Meiothermus taiwanensis]|uniref:hypothetical protein n=1 Tax=Meiothermus taiwanensis TaxID=172827 RepID=UPI000400EBFD